MSDLSVGAFIAWRGLSSDLFCDNATNFVGASRVLAKIFDQLGQCVGCEAAAGQVRNQHGTQLRGSLNSSYVGESRDEYEAAVSAIIGPK